MGGSLDIVSLPDDLTREILLRLPVKSLLRFRCVCKFWDADIKNPNFVSTHCNLQKKRIHSISKLLITHQFGIQEQKDLSRFHCLQVLDHDKLYPENIIFFHHMRDFYGPYVAGESNGIFCLEFLSGMNDDQQTLQVIALWNPSIRELRYLPPWQSHDVIRWYDESDPYVDIRNCVGFGYDPKTADYKVVRFVTKEVWNEPVIFDPNSGTTVTVCHADLYSLNSNSWSQIPDVSLDTREHPSGFSMMEFEKYNNGELHDFMCYGGILCFDFVNEEFIMRGPNFKFNSNAEYVKQLWFSRYIQKLSCPGALWDNTYFQLWCVKQVKGQTNWLKVWCIGPFPRGSDILGFNNSDNNNNDVFVKMQDDDLVLYDVKKGGRKALGAVTKTVTLDSFTLHMAQPGQTATLRLEPYSVHHYIESLVSIGETIEGN